MSKKLQRIVVHLLLICYFLQSFAGVLPAYPNEQDALRFAKPNYVDTTKTPLPESLTLSSEHLGLHGPFSLMATHSSLTGTFFSSQYLQQITERSAFNFLGEYGVNQYRINGTLGLKLNDSNLAKLTLERFNQRLPFNFDSGPIKQRVGQNAVGLEHQHLFENALVNSIKLGGYLAKAASINLLPLTFISNGFNCSGFEPGLQCINERHIAGGTSSGFNVGTDKLFSQNTLLEGKLYYDTLRYNTIYSSYSQYNTHGFGFGVNANQLLTPALKVTAGAEVRKIYDTYNLALSWLPPFLSGSELSINAQRVRSSNETPNNDLIGLQFSFVGDNSNYQEKKYTLMAVSLADLNSWVRQPAVKMNQVFAIAEEITRLVAPSIYSVLPKSGPLAGGELVTIKGTNFPAKILVMVGTKYATIKQVTPTLIKIISPPADAEGIVDVTLITPDSQIIRFPKAYQYTNSSLLPSLLSVTPGASHVNGVGGAVLVGSGFVPGSTTVNVDGLSTLPTEVTPTTISLDLPAHAPGNVDITVTNPYGESNTVPGGFNYIMSPVLTLINPAAGPVTGLTGVVLSGAGFLAEQTIINLDGIAIEPTNVSSTSLVFNAPAHAVGNVPVTVTTPAGTSMEIGGGFTYLAAPTVNTLTPAIGNVNGATGVSLSGTNFVPGDTQVIIGGATVTPSSVTSTLLTFNAPPHVMGTVPVIVRTSAGDSDPVPGGFTYTLAASLTSLTPSAAPTTGYSGVVIHGAGFVPGSTVVNFDGVALTPSAVTSTSITFNAPPHAAGSVTVSVTTPTGTSANFPGGFNYIGAAPVANNINPNIIPTTGLSNVTINGSNFVSGNTTVSIDGVTVTPNSVTPTSIILNAPAHAAGQVNVSVTTPGGTSANIIDGLTYATPPNVTSISPSIVSTGGATGVVLNGSGFMDGQTVVNFNGTPLTPTAVTPTTITFNAPANPSGTVSISVTTPVGTSSQLGGGFTYVDTPTVNILSPSLIPLTGANNITLTGNGFVPNNTTVYVNGVAVTPNTVTPTSLTFNAPAHAAGMVAVYVVTPGGTSANVSGGLNYIDGPTVNSLSPTSGPLTGQGSVVLTGTGFIVDNTVINFNGTLITPTSVTPTTLTFNAPSHAAGTVTVSVTTPAGTSANVGGGFTYVAVPTITSLNPSIIPLTGSIGIILNGTNFVPGETTVYVDGISITPTSVNSTSLTFDAPAHAAGSVALYVSTQGGNSINYPNGLTYTEGPTVNVLNPNSGPLSGRTGINLTGANFVENNTTVYVDGQAITPTVVTSSSLTFDAPAHAAGVVNVNIATPAGSSANVGGGFTYLALPTVGSLTPSLIPVTGSTGITLTGSGFIAGSTVVRVDGVDVTPTSITPTSVTFDAPAHAAGVVTVSVSTPGGNSANVVGGLTYTQAPTVTTLSPNAGPLTGVTGVTLSGTGFVDGSTTIYINGSPITPTATTPTSLTFDIPAGSAGTVTVSVVTPAGASANLGGGFTYLALPTVGSLTPSLVPVTGLTGITLTGSGFIAGNTVVRIDGVDVTPTSVTPTSVTFDVPAHAAGVVTVSISTPGGNSANVVGGLTYAQAPSVTTLSPNVGPLTGVTGVTLSGTGFIDGSTTIYINGSPVTPTATTPTSLTFDIPAGSAGTVTVSVVTPIGSSANVGGGFTFLALPTVGSLTPSLIPVTGSTGITLTGSGFIAGNTVVRIDGVDVMPTSVTPTSVTFDAPAHAAGVVTVSVSTPGGDSANVVGGLTYAQAPTVTILSPNAGPLTGVTGVTLSGTGFIDGSTTIYINGSPITPTVTTPTSLTFDIPAGSAGTVTVSVVTPAGASANLGGGFTFLALPTVGSLTPSLIPVTGSTGITLTGSGFIAGNTVVRIDGVDVTPTSVTPTSLTFDAPAHAAGAVTVSVSTPGGDSANVVGGLTYTQAPTVTTLSPNAGPLTGVTGVTLSGTGFVDGATTIYINGSPITPTATTPTSLTFDIPAGSAGTVTVSVVTPAGASANLGGGFTYLALPTVGSLTPSLVPVTGLTGITLTGSGFIAGNTVVHIDGVDVTPTSVTPTSLTFDAPAHAAGVVTVSVSTPGGDSANVVGGLTYAQAPTVTTLSPNAGPLTGVTGVTLGGTGFIDGSTTVYVDGVAITPTAVTPTVVTFDMPAHVAGTVIVYVLTSAGASANVIGGFTYINVPTVSSLSPSLIPITGLTGITLTGTGFVAGSTVVHVDGVDVTPNSVTPTSLTFDAPAHAAGVVDVFVTTPGGDSGNVSGGLTYAIAPTVSSLSPNVGSLAGVTGVTLSGSGFIDGSTTVYVDGVAIIPTAVTPTSITFDLPAHAAGTVTVSVSTPAGASANVGGGFTYLDLPTVGSLNPSVIPVTGFTGVILTGSDFVAGNTLVRIDGVDVTPTSVTPTSLTFDAPAHAAGVVTVSVSTPGGDSANVSGGLTYLIAPTVSSLSPNVGPLSGLTGVTLNGNGFIDGMTTVYVDGSPVTPTAVTNTTITFNVPAHAAGTVNVSVTTPSGSSANVNGGFTYLNAPVVGALVPSSGSINGVPGVVLNGSGFVAGYTEILVDAVLIVPSSVTATTVTFDMPPHGVGTATVDVRTPGGTTNVSGGFNYVASPTVTSLTPALGNINGVNNVVLTGTGFEVGNTVVNFDGNMIIPTSITSTSLVFDAPAHAVGTITVNVTTPGGTSSDVPGGFTYVNVPTVTQLTPSMIPLAGANGLTLTGSGFIPGNTSINLNGTPITPTSITTNELIFDAPASAAGTVTVSVTTPGGTSANLSGGLTYVAQPTVGVLNPSIISSGGASGITLSGTGFVAGNTTVYVDGNAVTPTSVSATSLTFNAPAHAVGVVTVSVTTPGGSSGNVSGGLTYAPAPTVTSLTPNVGPLTGVVGVTLSGTGFINGSTTVYVDGSPITPTAVTSTSLTFNVPAHAAGTVTVSVSTPAGSSANVGGGFTFINAPTVGVLNPSIISSGGASGITLSGTGFVAGNTTVYVDGNAVIPTSVSATSLTFNAPAHAVGVVTVSVTTPGGSSGNVTGGLTYALAPTVTSLLPNVGPLTGVVGVTLSGTGFINGSTTVYVDGSPITPTAVTSTSLTFNVPAHAAGTVTVSVSTPAGSSANVGGGFTFINAPTVGVLNPSIISAGGASGITLSGTGFVAGNTTVYVDGNAVTPTSVSATSLTFNAPAHAVGVVTVSVTTPGGSSGNVIGGLTYALAPTVTTLLPNVGPLTGVVGVTLSGTGFINGATTVYVNGSPITPTVVTSTSLTFDVPAHAAGTVTVSVSTPAGSSANVGGGFTYLSVPTVGVLNPSIISSGGASGITLSGTGFVAGNTTVYVDGNAVTPTSVSATSLTFNAPAHAVGVVTVSVTTPGGSSGNVIGGLTYALAPTVTTLLPNVGPLTGVVGVTLSGTGFINGATTVYVNGSPITPTTVTSTSLTFDAPAHAAGTVTVSVSTPAGSSANVGGGFTYLSVPTVGVLNPSIISSGGANGITLSGTGFVAGNTTVYVDGNAVIPTSVSATTLTFNAPAHAVGVVTVSVTTPGGSSGNVIGGLTYALAPTVTSLLPNVGSLTGAVGVTLSGTGFINGATTVYVDGLPITPTAVTSVSLTFDVPAHAAGTVTVSVSTPAGSSANVGGGFTFINAPTVGVLNPSIISSGGASGITLTGTGFVAGNTTVYVDGNAITPTSVSATSLTFNAPAHAVGVVTVSVTTPGGSSGNVIGGLTYALAPTVTALLPNVGPLTGVVGVTLSGTGFINGSTTVYVDGSPITPTAVTSTSLTFNVPAHAAGTVTVSVSTPAGSSANVGGGFTFINAPTVGVLNPSIISAGGANGITLSGTGFVAGNTTVYVDGNAVIPTSVSATTLTFNAPAHAAGVVTVSVTTPGGSSGNVIGGLTYALAPTVTSLLPNVGPLTGVVGVTLSGTGFINGATTVYVDGLPITPTAVTSVSLTFDVPAHAAGTVTVSVSTPAGSSANVGGGFTFINAPTVVSLSPSLIPVAGLTGLTLTGTGFVAGSTTVYVDGNAVTPTSVSATSLTFNAPAHAAGVVTVSVTTPGGSSGNVIGGLTYALAPTVTALLPNVGPLTGVVGVTLSGTGFINEATTVYVDGLPITPTAVTSTSLTFNVPAHAAGTVTVSVSTPAGSSSNVGGGFIYLSVPTVGVLNPSIISSSGANGITLTGTGFVAGNTTVYVDGNAVTPTSVSATSLTFNAPAHAVGVVTVSVTTPGGSSGNVIGGLTYALAPTVTALLPNVGPLTGVVGVTLSGTGFINGATTVYVDGLPIIPTAVTSVSLTFDVPAHAAGTVTVSVSTPAGSSANVGGGFSYVGTPTVGVLTPNLIPITGMSGITLTGTNFVAGNTSVIVDGVPITPTSVTPTSLTFNAPAHAVGSVTVLVSTPGGISSNVSGGLTYVVAPTLTSVTPNASSLSGYTGIVIVGTGFVTGNTVVNLDNSPITPTLITSTSLTFNAPAHAAGTVTLSVTTPGGTSTNFASGFTYVAAPTAGSLTPTLIPVTGYNGLSITGTGFVNGSTTVYVDGVAVTPTAVTPTFLTFNAPIHAAGAVTVNVTTPAGTALVSGGLTYVASPTVTTLNPAGAPVTGYNGVTLTGTGFILGNTVVNFDGLPITPSSVTATSLTFDAPAHAVGTVTVSVTTPGGTSANVNGNFTYLLAPTVISVSPIYIPLTGYTGVTLTGTNFFAANTVVNVGGTNVTPSSVTSTSLTFNAPAHAAGTVAVNATTPAGTSANVPGGLTYNAPPSIGTLTPSSGSSNGVSGVVVTGSNFIPENTTVNIDGIAVTPTAATTTSLTFNAPAHAAATVPVNVSTPVGTSSNATGGFTYLATPNITSCNYPGGVLSSAWLCVGTNMNAFPNTYINIQGGLTCTLGVTTSLLTTTIKTLTNLGGNTLLPSLYAGCTIKLCNNMSCTGLQSNVVAFT